MRDIAASFHNDLFQVTVFGLDEKYKIFTDEELHLLGNLDKEYSLDEIKDKYPSIYEKIEKFQTNVEELLQEAYTIKVEILPPLVVLRESLANLHEDISFDQSQFVAKEFPEYGLTEEINVVDLLDFNGFGDPEESSVWSLESAQDVVSIFKKNFIAQKQNVLEQLEQAITLKLITKKNNKDLKKVLMELKD